MAGFVERVVIEVQARTKGAAADLKDMGANVNHANGLFDKAKAGLGGLGNTLSGLIGGPSGYVALGTAAVAGAVKLADGFAKVALAADNMANRTGMSVDAASRWIAVADDVGVSTDEIANASQKLVQNMGKAPEAFAALGITASDTNEAMLQAIDVLNRTPAGAERAALGAQIFGKSWGTVSELIVNGSGNIRKALAEVSDAQVINDAEVAKAKRYRAAMDDLSDAVSDVGTEMGSQLAPAIAEAAAALADLVSGIDSFVNSIPGVSGGLGSYFQALVYPLTGLTEGMDRAKDSSRGFFERVTGGLQGLTSGVPILNAATNKLADWTNGNEDARDALDEETNSAEATKAKTAELAQAQADAAKAAADHEAALRRLTDAQLAAAGSSLAEADAWDRVLSSMDKAKVATDDSKTSVDEVAAANRDALGAILQYAGAADKAAEATAKANGEQYDARQSAVVQITALQQVKQKFPELSPVIDTFIAKLSTAAQTDVDVDVTASPDLASASSARNGLARTATAGGPIVVPMVGKFTNTPTAGQGGGGGGYGARTVNNVTVNVPPTLDGAKVVNAFGGGTSRNGGLRRAG